MTLVNNRVYFSVYFLALFFIFFVFINSFVGAEPIVANSRMLLQGYNASLQLGEPLTLLIANHSYTFSLQTINGTRAIVLLQEPEGETPLELMQNVESRVPLKIGQGYMLEILFQNIEADSLSFAFHLVYESNTTEGFSEENEESAQQKDILAIAYWRDWLAVRKIQLLLWVSGALVLCFIIVFAVWKIRERRQAHSENAVFMPEPRSSIARR